MAIIILMSYVFSNHYNIINSLYSDFQTISGDCFIKCVATTEHGFPFFCFFNFKLLSLIYCGMISFVVFCFLLNSTFHMVLISESCRIDWLDYAVITINPKILVAHTTHIYIFLILHVHHRSTILVIMLPRDQGWQNPKHFEYWE